MELHAELLNGSAESTNGATLEYHSVQDKECSEGQCRSEPPMISILFDESHGQLLETRLAKNRREVDALLEEGEKPVDVHRESDICKKLIGELKSQSKNWPLKLEVHFSDDGPLNTDVLNGERVKVLVLAAPVKPLETTEVEAIVNFVHQGGSLLVTYDYRSLYQHEQDLYEHHQINNPANTLLESFGLRIKRLLSYPPDEISDLSPHYLSSEVNKLFVREPAYLEVLTDLPKTLLQAPQVIGRLPWTEQPFLAAVEAEYGRVVVIADYAIFEDSYIDYGSNKQLALNIFYWLTGQNSIDCFDAQIQREVKLGKAVNFSITLHNPKSERLEHIECLLESDASAEILEPCKTIRSIARYGKTQLSWTILPKQLGTQSLKLTIDLSQQLKRESLFFDSAAQFKCLPDAEIDLLILDEHGKMPEEVETGTSFEVRAVLRQTAEIETGSLGFRLESSSGVMVESIEKTGQGRWRLNALKAGDCSITLVSDKTGQRVSRLLRTRQSAKDQIKTLERTLVEPLAAQLHFHASQIHPGFSDEVIQGIPCHLNTPEDHVRLIYSIDVAEQLLEALKAARAEKRTNRPLVEYLLRNIGPVYSPIYGCCLPYAPEFATHLRKEHGRYKEKLAQNFLKLEEDDQLKLEQNLAALILHEKYGHGFFFKKTKLGQQLAILYKHGMTRNAGFNQLRSPYPRLLYEEYKPAIQAMWDSAVIVNEGFATWVELTTLPHLSDAIGQAAYRRRDFLFNQDKGLSMLVSSSRYFQHFPPFCDSRYQEGCEYFQLIQRYFGEGYGNQCAILALLKSADVDFGISESNGQVQFGLAPDKLVTALLHDKEDDARADMRLRLIHSVLQEHYGKLLPEQNKLLLRNDDVSVSALVSKLIREKLGW